MEARIVEDLRRYDTPTLANAIETFDVRSYTDGYADSGVRCVLPELPRLVGHAITARITARPLAPGATSSGIPGFAALYAHALTQPEPRVVVIEDVDAPDSCGCFWGEVHATIFTALGCDGVVTNGLVRDLPEVAKIGFRLFAGGVGVSHGYADVLEVGCDVTVGGLTVLPGDLIHADVHGVLSVPPDLSRRLPAAADRIIADERSLMNWVRSPDFNLDGLVDRISH
jgi:regulator of RNase E activity RraA